jgi:hypothetical protein
MSTKRHHAEWLSLIETSGPFLSIPVLKRIFPQELDAHDPEHFRTLHLTYNEWEENQSGPRANPAIHGAWISEQVTHTTSRLFDADFRRGWGEIGDVLHL